MAKSISKEIVDRKEKLEDDIFIAVSSLVDEFVSETGLMPSGIKFGMVKFNILGIKKPQYELCRSMVNVKL